MASQDNKIAGPKPPIAIFSQDAELYQVLSHILEIDGFPSVLVCSVDEICDLSMDVPLKAVVLDCRPDNQMAMNCAKLRQDPRTSALPAVALIASGAEDQHIALLKAGIDECFIRPMAPAKLLAYLHSRFGRYPRRPGEGASLRYADIEMEVDSHHVRCNGQQILLGPIEFKLLRHMLENPEKVLSRDELIKMAWPSNVYVGSRTVDVHISRLRRSLQISSHADIIRTVRLGGYALEAAAG